jgi:hypothetical protein
MNKTRLLMLLLVAAALIAFVLASGHGIAGMSDGGYWD